MDNWWLNSTEFTSPIEDSDSIVQLIAAFPLEFVNQDKDMEKQMFQNIEQRINGI